MPNTVPRYAEELSREIKSAQCDIAAVRAEIRDVQDRLSSEIDVVKSELKGVSNTIVALSIKMQDFPEVITILRGEKNQPGLVAEVTRLGKLADKHEEKLMGNGKTGLIQRFDDLEKLFSRNWKAVMFVVIPIVSAILAAVGDYIVDALMK